MRRYNPKEIEPKWQKIWRESGIYKADMSRTSDKFYTIPMLPYPSGDLHIGHWYNFGPADTVARWHRMLGQNVFTTNGFDAFGLPAENAAIARKIAPAEWTRTNIKAMIEQIGKIGASYDWAHAVTTSDPEYYHWNQWLFLQLFKHKLAYRAKAIVNWCPKDQTVLANEQVVGENNVCERCGTPVIQKEMESWYFKITDFTERLLADLEKVDWPERVKTMQINWIGKSQGALIDFKVNAQNHNIKVFTTRPDTIFGATYMILAPEHPLVDDLTTEHQKSEMVQYVATAGRKTELERKAAEKDKTGVFTGSYAINPASYEKIPVWVADYALMTYGTGAIMAVPAHDERDYEFAKKYDLPIKTVILPDFGDPMSDEEYVEGVVVIPYDPVTGKYLALDKWANGVGLVGGGRNKDESFDECAERELAEETGLHEVRHWIKLGDAVYSHYYNNLKDVNKRSYGEGYLAIVDSQQSAKARAPEKHENFEPAWMGMAKIRAGIEKLRPSKGAGGVDHWLEMCDRAERAVADYKSDRIYQAMPYAGEGVLVKSGEYDGLSSSEAREQIIASLAKKGIAKEETNYRLRDWLISRQRYWGTPIPIIYCDKCGIQPVAEEDLPIILPENLQFLPTGQSPLIHNEKFVNVKCPNCGGPAKRETDTMDTFVDSSWYFLRYLDNKNDKAIFDADLVNAWAPVDHYIGGIEHAILHLLYARFITKFLHDHHGLKFDEPFKKLTNQGIILGPDGHKMSKSRGNVVSPDEQVTSYGADSLRLYMMFMGPYDQGGPYSLGGIAGTRRFLDRLWTLVGEFLENEKPKTLTPGQAPEEKILSSLHKAVKRVTLDIENLEFNTAISGLMEFTNELYKLKVRCPFGEAKQTWKSTLSTLVQLLAPFAPHISEELWQALDGEGSVHLSKWPKYDEDLLSPLITKYVVLVNGKKKDEGHTDSKFFHSENGEEYLINATRHKLRSLFEGKRDKKPPFTKITDQKGKKHIAVIFTLE